MNPDITKQFEALASQATRSIIASPKRRQAIADELLAHLHQTYEQELSQTKNESTALEKTLKHSATSTNSKKNSAPPSPGTKNLSTFSPTRRPP